MKARESGCNILIIALCCCPICEIIKTLEAETAKGSAYLICRYGKQNGQRSLWQVRRGRLYRVGRYCYSVTFGTNGLRWPEITCLLTVTPGDHFVTYIYIKLYAML